MSEKDEIAVPKSLTPEEQAVWDAKAKVRVLLNLWDLSGGKMKVKKGELTKRIVRTNETSQRYVEVLGELQATGAIEYSLVNRVTLVELTAKGKGDVGAIASYNDFKAVAIDVYDSLNRDYNLDDLVPIYRMRRAIGERVGRSQFNEWLLEMQATDIFQLIGGEMTDITPDKAEDSIKTALGALRYYVKRLNS